MSHNYQDVRNQLNVQLADLRKEISDSLQGFGKLAAAANNDGVLSHKHKELIAMAIGVSIRCQGCLAFHAKALVDLGCSRQEFLEMLQVAIYMGGGPSLMTAAEALKAYEDFGGEKAA